MIVALAIALLPIAVEAETFTLGSRRWTIERTLYDPDDRRLRIYCDGRPKLELTADALGGYLINAARGWYPVGYPVITVSGHTGMSHGQETRFYAIRGNDISEMLRIRGEIGGPVFRDLNGDGRNEWLFDDTDYWVSKSPTKFLVYRQTGFKVSFWKELPNPRRITLPSPAVRYF